MERTAAVPGLGQPGPSFIYRINDDWAWFNIKRTELTVNDVRPYNNSSSKPFGYYYVNPARDFIKIREY